VSGALAVTALAVVLAYWRSSRRYDKPAAPPRPVPADIHQQLSGYTFTRSDEGRPVFTIHASRTVAFKQGGTTVLEDVSVEMFGHTGKRRDILRTRRCDYNSQSGDLFSSGTVELELDADRSAAPGAGGRWRPIRLETSQLYYYQRRSLVVSDKPVHFHVGPLSGSARGVIYATREGWLEFKSDVKATLDRGGGAQPPLSLAATRARYDKQAGHVELIGPVEIRQGIRRARADRAFVFLDNRSRITRAVLEGSVHAAEESDSRQVRASAEKLTAVLDGETGQLQTAVAERNVQLTSKQGASEGRLTAQKLQIAFAGKNPQAQRGLASGGVHVTQELAASEPPSRGRPPESGRLAATHRELTSEVLRFTFQANGENLKDAATVGPGDLLFEPKDPGIGSRTIAAGQFLMEFDPQSRLEGLKGKGGTKITFYPPKNAAPGSPAQESTADRLVAIFDPATQIATRIDQTGNYQFREGDRHGSAERASYQAGAETMTLTGQPHVWDATLSTRAERMLIDLRTDTAEGAGKVQSTHFGDGKGDPTSVLADHVVAQRNSQTVHYEGKVRAWRGTDVVESTALDVFHSERRVSSGSQVLTSHLQPGRAIAGGSSKESGGRPQPVRIRAEHLEYFDQGRKASYRGKVKLQTEDTILESDKLDAYFSNVSAADSAELERAVADGTIRVVQPGRRATGQHAEYFAAEGKILLSGGPPTLMDAEKGFTSGQRLTFFTRDDNLFVTGGDESPTISRHRVEQ
jgi:lipopolysaccharide export system protein LptA